MTLLPGPMSRNRLGSLKSGLICALILTCLTLCWNLGRPIRFHVILVLVVGLLVAVRGARDFRLR